MPAPSRTIVPSHAIRSLPLRVLIVSDVLHPFDDFSVEAFDEGDVGHAGDRGRAVPVLLAGRTPHDVAGANLHDWASFALDETAAGGDDQHLAQRVCVPRGAGAGLEGHD